MYKKLPVPPVILYVSLSLASFFSEIVLLSPKSVTLMRSSVSRSRLAGFRSRWMIDVGRRPCRYAIPLAVPTAQEMALSCGIPLAVILTVLKTSAREPLGRNSVTMLRGREVVHAPRNCTTLGCATLHMIAISMRKRASARSSCTILSCSLLIATSVPRHVARCTVPNDPVPTRLPPWVVSSTPSSLLSISQSLDFMLRVSASSSKVISVPSTPIISPPLFTRMSTTSVFPARSASDSGVPLHRSTTLSCAPFSMSHVTILTLPSLDARWRGVRSS
mmetsp:Transcript_32511/g.103517  ORF Transcript_32511/g.103517 Transcript_32511/m.103517 type:complete len:276 (-) Transcript_32511:254-1081(-)